MDSLLSSVSRLADPNAPLTFPFLTATPIVQLPYSDLIRGVDAANATCDAMFGGELSTHINRVQKLQLLQFGSSTLRAGVWSKPDIPKWLNILKILARTQSDLEETLYTKEFVLYLISCINEAASEGESSSASTPSATSIAILSQSLRLLLNLCIVNKDRIHQALGCAAHRNVPLFGRVVEKKEDQQDSSSAIEEYTLLTPLLTAFTKTVNTAQEPDAIFFFVRILMFVLYRVPLAQSAIQYQRLYETLVGTFLKYSTSTKIGVELRDAESNKDDATSGQYVGTPQANLKLSIEILRLLANLSMMDDDLPSCRDRLISAGSAELYRAYLVRITALLAYGVVVPEEVQEGYKGDPIANASVGKLMSTSASVEADAAVDAAAVRLEEATIDGSSNAAATSAATPAAAASDSAHPATPTSVSHPSDSSSSTAHFQTAPSAPSATFTPVQRQQTRIVLEQMASESNDPLAQSLQELRKDASNLMIGVDGTHAADLLASNGCQSFHGLMQLLHRALILAGSNKKDGEVLLAPILSALSALVKDDHLLRAHAKRCIFLDLATPPLTVDGKPFKKADASNYAMTPAGAVSEKITDPDPLSLKSLVLQWIITLNFNLKQNVSEFLYRVCSEDTSEYIRLLGFGNAVGLLAEKGLPGFGALKQQAVNMDDVIKSGKKL